VSPPFFPLPSPHTESLFSNAYHTLFVGRLSYDTTEKKLRREMEQFGCVKSVAVVHDTHSTDKDKAGRHRGYGFVEFSQEEELTAAYKKADGRKIDGRRIVVDVERGRWAGLGWVVCLSVCMYVMWCVSGAGRCGTGGPAGWAAGWAAGRRCGPRNRSRKMLARPLKVCDGMAWDGMGWDGRMAWDGVM
jgi:hypothetical protein